MPFALPVGLAIYVSFAAGRPVPVTISPVKLPSSTGMPPGPKPIVAPGAGPRPSPACGRSGMDGGSGAAPAGSRSRSEKCLPRRGASTSMSLNRVPGR